MKRTAPSLAPMLRSATQGRLLARILVDPSAEHNLSELVAWTGSSMPTVLREVGRAERAGIVTSRKVGPARLVRADVRHPLYSAVRQVILGTFGPPAVIADEFGDLPGADAVLLFGSWAASYVGDSVRAPNDIDVLVVGDPDRDNVDDAAERAERRIGLPVQATVRSRSQWRSARESFVQEVKSRPIVPVLVDDSNRELRAELAKFGQEASQP